MVKEWYSDIPWHQKLGTFAGNEIDEALVLPYEALGAKEKDFCTSQNLKPEDCMLELGINNILGTLRTDTRYDPQDPKIKAAKECQDPSPSMHRSQVGVVQLLDSQHRLRYRTAAASVWNGTGSQRWFESCRQATFTAGTPSRTAARTRPQMPWYMAHYCDSLFPPTAKDVQDPVCYGDYLSPMNNGFNPLPEPCNGLAEVGGMVGLSERDQHLHRTTTARRA